MNHQRTINYTVDAISASAILATFAGLLPPLAGLAGLIWYGIQIWESKTVQRHVRRWRLASIRKRRERKANEAVQPDA